MASPEKAGGKQAGRFQPGRSGNPAGKPKGTRHKITRAAEALLDGEAEAITRKCVELAKGGDTTALRLCMERVHPLRKGRPVTISLRPIENAADLLAATSDVVAAMAAAEITPDEAATIAGVLETKRRALETVEIERRLALLESAAAGSH